MNKETICPCCLRHHFEYPAFYETCPVCGWRDDLLQREEPDYAGGANNLCLNDYKKEWESAKKTKTVKPLSA